MKTNKTLSLLAALSALTLLPVQAVETPAPQAAAPAAESAAQQVASELMTFIREMNELMAADSSKADKLTALEALKPRAEALGKRVEAIGMSQIRRAAMASLSPEELENSTTALDAADKDPELHDALEEIGALIQGQFPTTATPQEIAEKFLAALQTGAALAANTDMVPQQRADLLADQAMHLHRFYAWIEEGGDTAAVAAILAEKRELVEEPLRNLFTAMEARLKNDENEELAQAVYFYMNTLQEITYALHGMHNKTQPDGDEDAEIPPPTEEEEEDAAPPAPEVIAAVRDTLAFSEQICTILRTDKDKATKVAELRALKPQAAELGQRIVVMSSREMVRALKTLDKVGEIENLSTELAAAEEDPELAPAMQELQSLLRGEPDPSVPREPQDVAEELIATLGQCSDELETLPREQQLAIIRRMQSSLYNAWLWVMHNAKAEEFELASILLQDARYRNALNGLAPLGRLRDSADEEVAEEATLFFCLLIQFSAELKLTTDSPDTPES